MNYVLHVKDGVKFAPIAPAGFRILGALERTARRLSLSLTITAGTDGHPPGDPHTDGEAYDVRTHDLTDDQKRLVLKQTMLDLCDEQNLMDTPMVTSGGLATMAFFGWIEHPQTDAEHIHIQRRKGTVYA